MTLQRKLIFWPSLVAGVIIFASSRSHVATPNFENSDKVGHFFIYGLLGTLVCRLTRGWKGAVGAFLAVSAFGATDEWHQYFVPGRSCDIFDWLADTSGAALAIALYFGWSHYRIWLERPPLPPKQAE